MAITRRQSRKRSGIKPSQPELLVTTNWLVADANEAAVEKMRQFIVGPNGALDFNRIIPINPACPSAKARRACQRVAWGALSNARCISDDRQHGPGHLDIVFETLHEEVRGVATPIFERLCEMFPEPILTWRCWFSDESDDDAFLHELVMPNEPRT